MSYISICIPTYEMQGLGKNFLKQSFDMLTIQTFTDFDIVIADHSIGSDIESVCKEYSQKLKISYYRNTQNRGNSSANINFAIQKAEGKLIKILFQDDFLYDKDSLQKIVSAFDITKDNWLVTASTHSDDGKTYYKTIYPKYNKKIHLGKNTISSPSVLTIKNSSPLLFDEALLWLMDCDYYKRCFIRFGKPAMLNMITVVNRKGSHQITNTLATKEKREQEFLVVSKKFDNNYHEPLILSNVSLVAVSSIKIRETLFALEESSRDINFAKILFISDKDIKKIPEKITHIKCSPIKSIDEYNDFMLYKLNQYIDTDFALIVQYDGFVIRPFMWDKEFFKYDYIGAPWKPKSHYTSRGVEVRVGNGGFSLRSKKLLESLIKLNLPITDKGTGFYSEDGVLTNYYRHELENYGIKYAPVEIASVFSREQTCFDSFPRPFGFHKNKKLIPIKTKVRSFLKKINIL